MAFGKVSICLGAGDEGEAPGDGGEVFGGGGEAPDGEGEALSDEGEVPNDGSATKRGSDVGGSPEISGVIFLQPSQNLAWFH